MNNERIQVSHVEASSRVQAPEILITGGNSIKVYDTANQKMGAISFQDSDFIFYTDLNGNISKGIRSNPEAIEDGTIAHNSVVVHKNNVNETVSGIKTFVSNIFAPNLTYNTGNQTISGQKWFVYDDPTITQLTYNNNYANLVIVEGHGPGVPKFKPLTEYRPFSFGQPSYYYSGIGYETGSVQIYFDTGDSRWKYYFGGLASQYFIAKSPIVTPNNFDADFPLKGWTDNSNNIVDIKFSPQVTHNESHASGQRDALDPNSIGAVALTGNQSIFGIKTFSNGIISSVGITGANLVYNTGNQTISGVKTFATGVVVSGDLQVSGTGIFNALDLNNIDNLSLSGVDVTITSGNVILTNPLTAPNLVYSTGNQSISGIKTFIGNHIISGNTTVSGAINISGNYDLYSQIENTKRLAIAYAIAL